MKPSATELKQALAAAEAMRESGQDPDFLSKSLLYLHHRVEMLDRVCAAANRYMRFGQEEHEHADLLQALESARENEDYEKMEDKQDFGL